ncbi:Clp protease proteolytic subunit, partial [Tanacetum coccineum]
IGKSTISTALGAAATGTVETTIVGGLKVMIHQPAGSFSEVATGEFILEVGELLKLRETLTRVYVQRTGKPLWVVSEDMERDVFMSATEAQAYGIVDLVAVE